MCQQKTLLNGKTSYWWLDIYHDTFRQALENDGWTITHDPFYLYMGRKRVAADLGAERLISAEKGTRKLVVEVKSFVGKSDVNVM